MVKGRKGRFDVYDNLKAERDGWCQKRKVKAEIEKVGGRKGRFGGRSECWRQ